MTTTKRVLVVFVDALGPAQVEHLGRGGTELAHHGSVRGVLGYSAGALPTILTGVSPAIHGRMCTFRRSESAESPLAPLALLGLLPRIVHERTRLRRFVGRAFARARRYTGYFDLYRIPPRALAWLDVAEREDMFTAEDVGGAPTFLARARREGLRVYASPWQLPHEERWETARKALADEAPDLTFLYAPELDGVLHRHGNDASVVRLTGERIGDRIAEARALLGRRGGDVVTIVVGDHGMADVVRAIHPRPVTDALGGVQHFVDSTMLRVWGDGATRATVRAIVERQRWPGHWLEGDALTRRNVLSVYGDAIFVLEEGSVFAPSFVGNAPRGMHGYDLDSRSARAAVLSNVDLGPVSSLVDISGRIESELGLERAAGVTSHHAARPQERPSA